MREQKEILESSQSPHFSNYNKFDVFNIRNIEENFLGIIFFDEVKQENLFFVQSPVKNFWYFCSKMSLKSYTLVKQGNLFDKSFIDLKKEIFQIFKNARND